MGQGYFRSGRQHLAAEIERVQLLLREKLELDRVAGRLPRHSDVLDRGFVSPEEAEAAVDWPNRLASARADAAVRTLRERRFTAEAQIQEQVARSVEVGVPLPLPRLVERFGLDDFSRDALIVSVAGELDGGVRKLFGFLQNDITRQHLDVELALDLLCDSTWARDAGRDDLSPQGLLVGAHLLVAPPEVLDDDFSVLRMPLRPSLRVVEFLRDGDDVDLVLTSSTTVIASADTPRPMMLDDATATAVGRALEHCCEDPECALLIRGASGSGRTSIARALSVKLDRPLVSFAGGRFDGDTLPRLVREVRLRGGLLHVHSLGDDGADLLRAIASAPVQIVVELDEAQAWGIDRRHLELFLELPPLPVRVAIWRRALEEHGLPDHAEKLASRLRISPGAAIAAVAAAAPRAGMGRGAVELIEDCVREGTPHELAMFARRVLDRSTWEQLVLTDDVEGQLRELVDHYRHRHKLLVDWGFDSMHGTARGLSGLLEGPPGTGKTMAAGVVSREFDMELFQIDCSRVVSKYIGETEKNLAKIFDEGEKARAVLLFDEADSLFGQRTEVKSSSDRHANLETNYLLQRMDSYPGIVLLTTNFGGSIDEAFARRLSYRIQFGMPDMTGRRRLWDVLMPRQMERTADVDTEALAHLFEMSGGHIKNAIVRAAVVAARDGVRVNQDHLIDAGRVEYKSLGKLVRT